MRGKERRVTWRRVPVRDEIKGTIDLRAMYRPNDQTLAYAILFFDSEEARDAVLHLGSGRSVQGALER